METLHQIKFSVLSRTLMIDICSHREKNPTTYLIPPAIHVLTIITGISRSKLTLKAHMFSALSLVQPLDSPFSPPQWLLFPLVRIYFYIHQVAFKQSLYLIRITDIDDKGDKVDNQNNCLNNSKKRAKIKRIRKRDLIMNPVIEPVRICYNENIAKILV